MTSSNTSSWDSVTSQRLSGERGLGEEILITNSTRELVEFYWSNRKRFSGSYADFPAKAS
tara:strand:- start:556 stop:735 length:180 start_codon:yes stop_codon:yes gene_type:complete